MLNLKMLRSWEFSSTDSSSLSVATLSIVLNVLYNRETTAVLQK